MRNLLIWLACAAVLLLVCSEASAQQSTLVTILNGASVVSSGNPLPVSGSVTSTSTTNAPVAPATATATNSALIGCEFVSAGVTFTDGQQGSVSCDSKGNLQVGGNVASGSTDSGNPVKIGGRYNLTLPTFTDGQRGDFQISARGAAIVQFQQPGSSFSTSAVTNTTIGDGLTNTVNTYLFASYPLAYNGATWDKSFTCTSTASVSVTAGNTTQIVALSGSTNIRVCSFAITMSAAGTAQFVAGTGSNCGSGTANITAAMSLATATPLAMAAGPGVSVFRAGASNALCVAAVTGNVTGFVTYAQF